MSYITKNIDFNLVCKNRMCTRIRLQLYYLFVIKDKANTDNSLGRRTIESNSRANNLVRLAA